ncbi:C protein [Bat paramyxovirus]|uniref:C protein n=1 Tax=bat paramyxovirus 16797 TaxID=3070194 RepID=A0AA48FWU2_9MONO|nr:C protein [Bat paramyxovirus]AYM47536.1 C protein [bat paramyxovirus 16797]
MVSRLLNLFRKTDHQLIPQMGRLELEPEEVEESQKAKKIIKRNQLITITDKRGNSRALLSQQKNKALILLELTLILKEQSQESSSMTASLLDPEMTMLDMFETLLIQLVENNLKIHRTYLMMKEDHFLTMEERVNLKKAMNLLLQLLSLMEGLTKKEIMKLMRTALT